MTVPLAEQIAWISRNLSPRNPRAHFNGSAEDKALGASVLATLEAQPAMLGLAEKAKTALAALPSPPQPVVEAQQWRPIADYRRDHDPSADTDWGPNALLFVPSGQVAPASDYRILTGRLEADMWLGWDDGGAMYDIEGTPTHWMPLPAPPTEDK